MVLGRDILSPPDRGIPPEKGIDLQKIEADESYATGEVSATEK
jgi:hypothetical protein